MTHLTEQEQILAHYGEPLDEAKGSHLRTCAQCGAELEALAIVLDSIDDPGPELPSSFEENVWNRLRWQLRPAKPRVDRRWLAAAAAALILAGAGFFAGRAFRSRDPIETVGPRREIERPLDAGRDAVVNSAVTEQVDRSERLLVALSNRAPDQSGLTDESLHAERLLASNRIYRLVARESGATEVASLLDDIEPILLELAHSGSEMTAAELEAIQKRIESRELVFKLRVLSSSLKSKPNNQGSPPVTPTRL